MGTYRLYTGEDGQSHIESIEPAKAPDWAQGLAATQISLQEQLDLPGGCEAGEHEGLQDYPSKSIISPIYCGGGLCLMPL